MTYLLVRHLDPMETSIDRYFGSQVETAKALIQSLRANLRDQVAWLALADLAEECGYSHLWDFRSRIEGYFE